MKRLRVIVGILFYAFACGTNLWAQDENNIAIQRTDSLDKILASGQLKNADLLSLYVALSLEYEETDHERAVRYCKEGIVIAEQLNNWRIAGELYRTMGYSYFCRNQYETALICFDNMLEVADRATSKEDKDYLIIRAYVNKGVVANAFGRLNEEINYYFQALIIAEANDDKDNMQKLYGNIGSAYLNLENDAMAELYFTKGEAICIALNDSLKLYYHLNGLSNISYRQKNYEKALEQAISAYQIIQNNETMLVDEFFMFLTLTRIYEGMNDLDKAIDFAEKAIQAAETINSSLYMCWALHATAFVELSMGKYAQAEATVLRALEADSSDLATNVDLYKYLTQANIMLNNKEKANEYLNRLMTLSNEFSNSNYQTSLSEMEVKYETEKKEMRILVFEEEKRLMTRLSIAAATVLLLALTAATFLWRWAVQKKRLAEQQKQLAEQQVIQLEQEQQLIATQAVLDGEVQERTRLARDLHDGLGSILAATKYNLTDIRKESSSEAVDMERFETAINLLDESMREMRRVAHHLMPESLSNYGLKQSITDFCNSVPHVKFNYYGDETRLEPKLEVMIYRIMHELVSNALKHSKASHILVEIVRSDDTIALTVQDDGCGFDAASTEFKGMGLANIRTRVAAYNGILLVDSQEGVGTEVNVELRIES